jgi:hypothetical protein
MRCGLAPAFAVPALLLGGPYAWGVVQSLRAERITAEATGQQGIHAADLVSFLLPALTTPGWARRRPGGRGSTPTRCRLPGAGLGRLILAAGGWWTVRGTRPARFWVGLAAGAALLAMGTTLQIAGARTFFGVQVPLPFALIGRLPIFNLIGKVERFEILTLLALAVLGGRGAATLLAGATRRGDGWWRVAWESYCSWLSWRNCRSIRAAPARCPCRLASPCWRPTRRPARSWSCPLARCA